MEELTTEQKIIMAARQVFTKKGYAATRTRDIAKEAGINLALLNYYFKSKENLFKIIIIEKFMELFGKLSPIISDENISLEAKIENIVSYYTNLLTENPDLPIFVLNELKNNEHVFDESLQNARELSQPIVEKQIREKGIKSSVSTVIVNILALTIFPFLVKPMLISSGLVPKEDFQEFIKQRQEMIPDWITKLSK